MRRFMLFMMFGLIILLLVLLFWKINTPSHGDNGQINDVEKPKESAGTMAGYYYFGFFDEREKLDGEAEKDYFYYMDHHFKDYQRSFSPLLGNDEEQLDEEVLEYFESIGGLWLYSIPLTEVTINNGDYITFTVTSPIKESYPAQIDRIEQVEVLFSRKP